MIETMNKITDHWKDYVLEKYDLIWETGNTDTEMINLWTDAVHLQGKGIKSALEIGCGSGDTCKFLASKGMDTLGVDINPPSIEKAKLKENENLKFECTNFSDLKLKKSIDFIYDNTIYQNCVSKYTEQDVEAYLGKLYEISRPGTLFFGNWMKYNKEVERLNDALPLIHIQDVIEDFGSWWDIKFIREGVYDFTREYNKELGVEYLEKGGITSYAVLMERKK